MLVRLYDEKKLITDLQTDTLALIRWCPSVEPIKKLIACHDILKITVEISYKFPTAPPHPLECDEGALLHLRTLIRELRVYHHSELPTPDFPKYVDKIMRLFLVYQVPRTRS